MRICPILMLSRAFLDAISQINAKRGLSIQDFKKVKDELLKPFECPALALGMECNYHVKGEDTQNEQESKPDQCHFGSINFAVNMQPVSPGMMPPGMFPPGLKI